MMDKTGGAGEGREGVNGAVGPPTESPDALVERGLARLREGQPDRAVEEFEAAIRLDPAHPKAHVGRGRARLDRGEYASAIRDFDEALRSEPDDAQVIGFRAAARHRLGDLAGAVADYDRAITLAPQMAWLWHGRGSALHADDDLRAAIADYTRAIALEPDAAHPYRNRGLAHAADGDDEAAIADYTEAIRLGPADASSYFHRGEARSRAGDDEAAVADFSEAIRLDPGHAKAYRARAAALEALGRDDEAEADYDRAERLGDEGHTGGAAMSVTERKAQIHALIQSHFEPTPVEDLTVTERQFPLRVRADLQRAIDGVFAGETTVSFFCGVRKAHSFEGISFSELLVRDRNNPAQSVPPLYEEIDVGEDQPVRCLRNGLWLLESGGTRFAVFLEQSTQFHRVQTLKIQVATPNDPRGFRVSQDFLKRLEEAVHKAESYRGKILSLEAGRSVLGEVVRHPGPPAGPRRAGSGHPAGPDARTAGAERDPVRPAAVPAGRARPGDQEGAALLRAAGHRQDAHDPLPGRGAGGAHDAPDHGRAGRPPGRVHGAGAAAPAEHRGDRGRGPDRQGPHDDGQPVRGGAAQQAPERDGRAAAGRGRSCSS